jgi:hypothetical protein
MNFFKEVIASLLKEADESFSGHSTFRVADPKAVGENPIREYKLDAVPLDGDQVMVTLSMDGGEKAFEKTLSSTEANHIFSLISSDLAEAVSLTTAQKYDEAKASVTKVLENYAEKTDTPIDVNLPALHNTQASKEVKKSDKCPYCKSSGTGGEVCDICQTELHVDRYGKDASINDDKIWRKAKITMQNLWFSTTDELLDYQKKQKGATGGDQDHIPLWDKNKDEKKPTDKLAPASLSYEDVEEQKAKQHDDMQDHIDEKIKTELESALQQKAASVFGPDQVELVEVLRKNGRNWDEIKKILVKDFGFDKDSTNIFVDEQRQGSDPTGIEVEPVKEDDKKEDESPLTPPEDLVSPETHDQLLKDHEDKKKHDQPAEEPVIKEEAAKSKEDRDLDKYTRVCPSCRSLVLPEEMRDKNTCNLCHKDASFTPEDIMAISELDEIARADNDDIRKVAKDLKFIESPKCPDCGKNNTTDKAYGDDGVLYVCRDCGNKFTKKASVKTAADGLNPLQEPVQQDPTTPASHDVVPMGKKPLDHQAPQKGDRVFVSSDMSDEKAGFEGTFVSSYKSEGNDLFIVETDEGDLLDVAANRVVKISENAGAQDTEPSMAPVIDQQQKDEEIQVTPKMTDLHSSQDEALAIKAELDEMMKIVKEAESSVVMPMMYGIDDDSILQYANGSIYANKIKSGEMQDSDWQALVRETGRWMTQVGRQKVSQTFSQDAEWKLDPEQIGKLKTMFNVLPKDSSLHTEAYAMKCKCGDRIGEHKDMKGACSECKCPKWEVMPGRDREILEKHDKKASAQDTPPTMYCANCKKDTQFGSEWKGETLFQSCKTCGKETGRLKGSEKDAAKEYKPCPNCGALSSSPDVCLSCLKPMKQASDFEKGISQNKTSEEGLNGYIGYYKGHQFEVYAKTSYEAQQKIAKEHGIKKMYEITVVLAEKGGEQVTHNPQDVVGSSNKTSDNKIMVHCKDCNKTFYTAPDSGIEQCPDCMRKPATKTADPVDPAKTQLSDVKITPDFVDKNKAIPASEEQAQVISKLQALEANLSTIDRATEDFKAKMKLEIQKMEDATGRATVAREYQEQIEKLGVLISATENALIKYGNMFYSFQQEEKTVVPKLTQKDWFDKFKKRFEGAEKFINDVKNGMLALGKTVITPTVTRWPEKRSELSKQASSSLDMLIQMNNEMLEALKLLSQPL